MSSSSLVECIQNITTKYVFHSDLIILIIGMIGNILLILIFTTLRIFRGNQCAFYLTVESIANIGLFLAMFPSDIVGYILGTNPARLSVVWCKIQLMISYSCGLFSFFTICFLAFDQYLSTNYRYSWRNISTIKLAHRLAFTNVTFVIFHGILFLIFAEIGSIGCSIYNAVVKIYFTFFFYPILSSALPLTVSGLLSLLAYRNVRRIVRRQIPLTRRRLDHQMTAMALARVISITIFGLPFIGVSLYGLNLTSRTIDQIELVVYRLFSTITFSLLYINYAVSNFISLISEIIHVSLFSLDQFLYIFYYITSISSSSETFFRKKALAFFDKTM